MQVSSQVLYLVKREHNPKASLNDVCYFISEELMEEVGRGVGSSLGTALNGLITPWRVLHGYSCTMVTEFLEVVTHGGVHNVIEVSCKV